MGNLCRLSVHAGDLVSMFHGIHEFQVVRAFAEMDKLGEFPELTNALMKSYTLNAHYKFKPKLACHPEYMEVMSCTNWGAVLKCVDQMENMSSPTEEKYRIYAEFVMILERVFEVIPIWLCWWQNDRRGCEGLGPLAISTSGNSAYIQVKLDEMLFHMTTGKIDALHSKCKSLVARITELSRKPIQVGKHDHGEIIVAEQVNS